MKTSDIDAFEDFRDNHEIWYTCKKCGHVYDLRLEYKCPKCGAFMDK